MDIDELGAAGGTTVLFLADAPLTAAFSARLLGHYRFLIPKLHAGEPIAVEEVVAALRLCSGGQVDVLCATAGCWPLARQLMEDAVLSDRSIIELDSAKPGSLILSMLDQALPDEEDEPSRYERAMG